jgi:hypothetical protein
MAAERVRSELEGANDTIKAAQDALSARPGESLVVTACRMRDRLAAECQASRTLADRLAAAHELLGGAREEDVLDAARRVVRERNEARQQSSAFDADADILVGTSDGKVERLADVIAERNAARVELAAVREALDADDGESNVYAAIRVVNAWARLVPQVSALQEQLETIGRMEQVGGEALEELARVRAILDADDGQPLAGRARDVMAELHLMGEAVKETPVQVFRPRISATVHTTTNGKPYVSFEVGALTDPAILALPVERLGLLALCVMERP